MKDKDMKNQANFYRQNADLLPPNGGSAASPPFPMAGNR
jgi:hypothetical protein